MTVRTAFSYYGGKGMLVGRFPAPEHDTIIEPFAGGAAYALRYHDRNVIINDLNTDVVEAWRFIQSPDALSWCDMVPRAVSPGTRISDMMTYPRGLTFILRSAANVGTAGQNKCVDTVTSMGAANWCHNTIDKIQYWHKKIQHWTIMSVPYSDLPNMRALNG